MPFKNKNLKLNTNRLIRIAKKERPKAVKFYLGEKRYGKSNYTRAEARKAVADNIRSNRKMFGSREARRLILKGHGY